uniref:Uncharacterized protein n=1 Tax=Timema tahoe TaxID=61484 RepID=A0A7R9FG41_9NEOP|nr:unnamed protein product [Timema tahoe]
MGVAINCRIKDGDSQNLQGQTDELVCWINKMKTRKTIMKRQRRKNFRIEAILSCALSMAEYELKSKQQQRMLRWQMLKMKIYERNCEAVKPSREQSNSSRLEKCEEIDSLNSFMCLLKESSLYILRRNVNLWASCDSLGESGRGRL